MKTTFLALAFALALPCRLAAAPLTPQDEAFLDDLSHRAFLYFWEQADPKTGLVPDRAGADGGAPRAAEAGVASVAATGFGLSALCIGAARGWVTSQEASERARRTLAFLADKAPQEHGFFYHFLDAKTGARAWKSEVSSIDTGLLLAGALTVGQCFADPQVKDLAARLYARVDFPWMLAGGTTLSMGWKPESGFIPARWDTYSEHMVLDLLAIGSPAHPVAPALWDAWARPRVDYSSFSYVAGVSPLFIHQYSQAYVDFRSKSDRHGIDYFENSVQAALAQRAFFETLTDKYPYLGPDVWGLTASDGKTGYHAWGAPPLDPAWDGTLVPCAAGGSLMLTPQESLAALREMKRRWGDAAWGRYGFADAFDPATGWTDTDVVGIDQGVTLLSAEDLRGGLVWEWFMRNPEVAKAMAAAGLRDDSRVEDLLSKMTLEEKLGQLQQLGGPIEGSPELTELARQGRLGSTLNVRGAKTLNALQRAAVEGSRLKVPLLFAFDVIHGYRTVFPIPLAMASSWDPAVPERAARLSAEEASADGLRWTFSPMVDVARDPRWGRVAEGAGEDPYLGAAMARAYVRGYQGGDPSAPDSLAACAKHWVGYGAAEAGRDYNTTELSERTLREVYFPPFKAALDAGVLTFMSAFNDLDGVPASANPFTLSQVLRREWGFPGLVVSDWESVLELIAHGMAADGASAARQALTAGVDMEMASRLYGQELPALIREGRVPESAVDQAVRRVLWVKDRLGLFERPYADESRSSGPPTLASRAAARAAAARSMVLLKNDGGVLPLPKTAKRVAVIGELAADGAALLGAWSGDGRAAEATTILDGVRAALPAARVEFSTEAAAARGADAVILVLGEKGDMSGEASSRADPSLPDGQLELARAALAAGRPTAVVLLNGRPLILTELAAAAPAILEAWQPGTEGGSAVADALFGDADPGGKLPMTFPRALGQVPLYYNHKSTGRPPSDSDHYTSKYLDAPVTPLFPFGWGLSYSSFTLSGLSLSTGTLRPDGTLTARVTVTNAGARAGDEVVQLYIHRRAASVTPPVRALKGFRRVTLAPGAAREVTFTLTPAELGLWGRDMRWSVEPGDVDVYVGTNSLAGLSASFRIED